MKAFLTAPVFPHLPIKIASGHASQGCAGFQRRFRSCRIPKSKIQNQQSSILFPADR
jgi:hypothetical protein